MSRMTDDMKQYFSSINEPQKRSSVKDTLAKVAAGVPAQPTRQKQYSVSPAGLEAMIWDRSGNDETLRAAAYAEADRLYSTPGSGYYQPYRGVTNQSYLDDLQARGVDVSGGVNDTFFSQNAWYQQHLIPSDVTGTPGKPNAKTGTNEQWIAYDLYQLQKDEETTRKAESEWAQLQKEVAYWTRRGLTNEEIRGKIDMGKYKTLQGMDEAAARGTYTPLNRAVGYSQDAVDGVIWATRNGDDSGDYFRASVYAQQGKGRLDSGSTGLQIARRKPGSSDWHPYYDGSTDDDARMLFDRDDFDMDWLNGTREEVLSSGDSDRIKAWQRVYAAESVTEQAEQEKADLDAWIAKRAEKVAEGKLERKTKKDGTLETWEEMAERLLFTDGSGAFDILDIKTLPKLDAGRANGKPVDLNRSVRYRREDAVAELAGVLRMATEKKTAQQLLQDEIANLGAEENARQARIPAGSLKSSRRGPATQQEKMMEGMRAVASTALDSFVDGIGRIFGLVPEEGEPNPSNIPASALKDQTGRWIASQRMNQQRKLDEKEEAQRAEYEAGREKTASPEQAEADAMRRKEEYEAGLADGSIQNTRIQQIQEEHSTFFDTLDMLTDREGGKSGSAFIRSLPMRASTSYNDVMAAQGGSNLFSTYLAENGEISAWDDETLMDYLETAGYAYYDMGTADQDAKDHMMLVLAEAWRRKGMLTDEQLADPGYMAKWYQKASGALDEYWQMGADSNYLYFGASGEGDDSVSSMSDTQIESHLRRVILNGGSKMVTAANDAENAAQGEPYISRTFGPQDEAVANEVYRVAPWLADASLYSDDIGGGVSWLGQDMVDMLQAIQSENASPEDVLDAWVIGYRAGKAAEDANLGTGVSPAEWMQENPEYLRAAREITERVKAADEEVRLQTEAEQAQLKAAQVAALKRVMQATMEGNTDSLRDSDVFTYKIATQVSDEEIHDLGESSPVYKEAKAAYRQMLRDRGEPTEGIAYEGRKAAGVYRIVAETLAKHQKLAEAMDMTVDELYEAWPELQMTPEQLAQTAENTYNAQFNEATLPEEQRQAVQILGISPEQQEPVGFWNTVGLAVGSGTMQFLSSYPGFVSDVIERDADVTAKTNQAYYTDKYGYSKAAGAFKRDILAHAATLGETDPRKAELLGYIRDSETTGRDIFSYPIDLNVEAVRRAQAPFERVMAANSDLVERRGTDLEKRTYRVVSSATNSGLGSGASMLATAATGGSALIGTALGFFPMSFDNAYKSAIAKGYTPGDAKAYATAQAAAETLTEQAVINSTLNPSDRFIDWLGNATMDRIATSGLKSKILYNAAHFTASYVRSVAEETAQEYFQSAVSGAIDVVSAAMRGEKINWSESFSEFSPDQMLDTFLSVALSVTPNAAATYAASSQAAVDRTLSRLWNAMSAEDRAAYDNSFTRFKDNPFEVSRAASAVAGAARRALEAAAAAPTEQAAETAAPVAETAQTETETAPAAEAQEAPAEAGEQAVPAADTQETAQTAEGTAAEAAPAPTGVQGAQTVAENGPVEQARRNVEVLTQQQSEVQTQLEEAEGRIAEAQKELKKRKDKKRNIKRRKSGNNATTDIDDEIAIWETEVKNRKTIAENLRKRLSTVTEQLGKAQETAREAGRAQNGTQAVNEATDATAPAQTEEQTAPETAPETVSEEQTAPAAVEETAAEEQTAPANVPASPRTLEAQQTAEGLRRKANFTAQNVQTMQETVEAEREELKTLQGALREGPMDKSDVIVLSRQTSNILSMIERANAGDANAQGKVEDYRRRLETLEATVPVHEQQLAELQERQRQEEEAARQAEEEFGRRQQEDRERARAQRGIQAAPEATERTEAPAPAEQAAPEQTTEAPAETAPETVQEAPAAPVSEQATENTSAPVETQEAPAQAETEAVAQETAEEPKTGTERLEENARLLSEAGAQVATATGNLLTFPASSRPIDLVDSWSRSATDAIIMGTRMSLLTRTEQDALNNRLDSVRQKYRYAFALPQETEEQKAAKTKALEDVTRDMLQVASSLGDLVNLARDMHMTAANEEMQAGFAERKGEIMRAMMGEILNRPDTMTYMVNQMAATFTSETIATTMQNGLPTDVSFFGQELVAKAQEIAQKKLEAQKKLNAAEADLNKAKAAMMRNNTARLNARQKGDSKAETRCINKSAQLEADVAKARKAVAAAEDEMTAVITEQDAVEEQVMEVIRQDSMARAQAAMQQEAERFNEEEAERQEAEKAAREEAQAEAEQPAEETQEETEEQPTETESDRSETNAVSQLVETARTPAQRAQAVELATAPDDLDTIIYDTECGYTKQQKRKAKDKRLAAMSSEEDFHSVVTDDTGAWSKTDKQRAAEGLMDIWRQGWTEERATRVLDAAHFSPGIFSSAAVKEAGDWYNEYYRQKEAEEETAPEQQAEETAEETAPVEEAQAEEAAPAVEETVPETATEEQTAPAPAQEEDSVLDERRERAKRASDEGYQLLDRLDKEIEEEEKSLKKAGVTLSDTRLDEATTHTLHPRGVFEAGTEIIITRDSWSMLGPALRSAVLRMVGGEKFFRSLEEDVFDKYTLSVPEWKGNNTFSLRLTERDADLSALGWDSYQIRKWRQEHPLHSYTRQFTAQTIANLYETHGTVSDSGETITETVKRTNKKPSKYNDLIQRFGRKQNERSQIYLLSVSADRVTGELMDQARRAAQVATTEESADDMIEFSNAVDAWTRRYFPEIGVEVPESAKRFLQLRSEGQNEEAARIAVSVANDIADAVLDKLESITHPMTPEVAADRVLEAREQEDIAEQEATMDDGTEEAARRQEEAQEALAEEAAAQAEEEAAPEAPETVPETVPEAPVEQEAAPEAPVEQEAAPEAPAAPETAAEMQSETDALLQEKERQYSELKDEYKRVFPEYRRYNDEMAQIQKELSAARKPYEKLKKKVDSGKKLTKEEQKQYEQLIQQMDKLEKEQQRLTPEYERLTAEHNYIVSQIAELGRSIDSLKDKASRERALQSFAQVLEGRSGTGRAESVSDGVFMDAGPLSENDRLYNRIKQAVLEGRGYMAVVKGGAYSQTQAPLFFIKSVDGKFGLKSQADFNRLFRSLDSSTDVFINADGLNDKERLRVAQMLEKAGRHVNLINQGQTDLNRILAEWNAPEAVAMREKVGKVMDRINGTLKTMKDAVLLYVEPGTIANINQPAITTKVKSAMQAWMENAVAEGGEKAAFLDTLLNMPDHMMFMFIRTFGKSSQMTEDNVGTTLDNLFAQREKIFGESGARTMLNRLDANAENDKVWTAYKERRAALEQDAAESSGKKSKKASKKRSATDAYIPATETRQLDLLTGLTEGDRHNEQQPAPQTAEIAARTPPAQTEQAKKGKSKVQSPQTIFRQLAKDLHLGNDIRGRSFDVAGALGYYQRQEDFVNIRAGHSQDFWTTMHEIGHAIHSRLGNYQPSQQVIDHFKSTPLAEGYSPEQYPREAQAELNRIYMLNRDGAINYFGADEIVRYEKALEDAGMMGYVTQARLALAEYIAADTDTRARAMIVTGPQEVRPSSFRQQLADMTRRFIASQVDDTYAAARVDHIARQGNAQGAISLQQSLTMQKFSARTADALLTQALSDASGQRVRESFHDAIFKGDNAVESQEFLDDVMLYWLYKHALDRHQQMGNSPIQHGNTTFHRDGTIFGNENLSIDEIRRRVAEYEATKPAVVAAQIRATNWWGDFMKTWMVDTGLISKKEYDRLRKKWPNYIPTMRDVGAAGSNVRGGNESFKFKSIKGSDLNILNPFATMPKIVLDTVTQARRNQSAGILYDMMTAENDQMIGIGEFGHIVSPDTILSSVRGTTVWDTLNKALSRLGLTTSDISVETEDGSQLSEFDVKLATAAEQAAKEIAGLSDEEVAQFLAESPKVTNLTELLTAIGRFEEWHKQSFTSMPNVITYQENGKNHLIYVEDVDLFHALTDGKNVQKSQQVLTAVSILTRTMSRLTTGSNPLFAAKNFARDFQQSVNHGSWAVTYADGIVKWARAAYELVRGTDTAQQYLALGGGGFTYIQGVNSEENGRENIRKLYGDYDREGVTGTAANGFRRVLDWLTLDRFNELIEQASRYAEYRFGKHDLSTAEGRQKAFLAAQEATVNFSLKGYGQLPAALRAIIPFYNATLQGTWQSVKTLSEAERDRLPARIAKTLVNNMILGALSFAACKLFRRDDDDKDAYDMLSDEIKMSNIIFPNFGGQDAERRFIRIPLTQNVWGKAFYAAGQRLMAEAGQDALTYDLANVVDSILSNAIPTDTIANPIIDVMLNRTWYGGTLEPSRFTSNNTPVTQRFTDSTLGLFRRGSALLAQAGINVSPIALQYLSQQYSGFIGQVAIPAFSEGQYREGFTPLRNLLDVVRNAWTIEPAYTNDVSNAFYSAKNMLSGSIAKTIQQNGRSDVLRETLTEDQVREAYLEAVDLTSKGGAIYEANEEITRLYNLMDALEGNDDLDEHTKRVTARNYRMQIAQVQAEALAAYEEYRVKYMDGRTMINRILGIDQPTISVKLPDIQTMDRDEPYMQALYAARDGGEKIKMPQPSTSITVNKRTYNVTRMPPEAQEAYTEAYRNAYRDYVENADELTAAVTEKAHSKAHAAAKAALMEWVSDNDWNTDNEEGE